MRILVTGATGFIGTEVVEQLAASRHDVRALVRRVGRAPLVSRFDVEVVHGDLLAPASIDRAMRGVDAVVHLGGRATFEPYRRLAPTLVEGTRTVAEAAVRHGVERLVFGSSAFVHRGDGTVIDASTPPDPVLGYGRAKVDAERILRDEAGARGVGVASLRLPHVYGPQSLLFGLVRRRVVPFPGDGSNRFAQLHVADAARALIAAIEQGWEGIAPIADLSTPTWNEYFDVLGRYAPRVRVVRFPADVSRLGAAVVGPVLGRLGATMVAPDTIRGWNLDISIDAASTWEALGLRPRYRDVGEGIPSTLDDVVAFRWRHPVNDWS